MKENRKSGRFKVPGDRRAKHPIEDSIQLEDYVSFSSLDGSPGAALLSDGKNFQFKFAFRVHGIHPTLSESQMETICSFIETGMKSIPDGEFIVVEQSVFPDNQRRIENYKQLAGGAPNPLFREMVKSAACPGEYFSNLSPEAIRNKARLRYKRKEVLIYVSATSNQGSLSKDKTEAFMTRISKSVSGVLAQIVGDGGERSMVQLRDVFVNAQAVYEDWLNILSQMRLTVEPLNVRELAWRQWREFNDTPMRELPQLIVWDGERIDFKQTSEIHVSSWLFDDSQNVPQAKPDYVRQQVGRRTKYTGILTLRHKPKGWRSYTDQLKYLYKTATFLPEYKIVFTATRAPQFLVQKNIDLIYRQSIDAKATAAKRNLPSTRTRFIEEQADKASEALLKGGIPLKTSLCFLVSKDSVKELNLACRKLQSSFILPASLEIETDYTYITWLQCFPQLSYQSPLFRPFDRTRAFMSSSIPAFMPLVKVTSPDDWGLEFITEEEKTPYYLDIANVHRHILFLAITRSGKSVLFAQILMLAMCSRIPMVVVDYPRESGDSTFGPITRLAGEEGAYLNIAEESNNFFEPPDLSAFEGEEKFGRMVEAKDYVLDTLMIIMYGANAAQDDREKRTAKSIFGNLINLFYQDAEISQRFAAAIDAPIGSEAWRRTPTLHDFIGICNESTLRTILESVSEEHIQLVNEIKLRLSSFVQTTVGRSMSAPTSIPSKANLLVFAFKGISSNEDAAVLMASAAAAAMRRTLSAPASILFMDEASILSKFESLMAQCAKIAANGAKSGIRLMMALQTPASIAKSASGDEILANLSTRLIGRVDAADAPNYSKILKIPEDVIKVNTAKSFYPVREELYSRWLIVDRGEYTFVRSYAPPLLLAAVANNPDEEEAKAAFLEKYGDPVLALKAFAKELILANQEGRPLRVPGVDHSVQRVVGAEEYAVV